MSWDAVGYQGRGEPDRVIRQAGKARALTIKDTKVAQRKSADRKNKTLPLTHASVTGSEKEPPRRQGSLDL